MAGEWIKMRCNLWDDPRVSRLCDDTESTEATVIGALYMLWAMADTHSVDGHLPGLSARQLDRKVGLPGFGAALMSIGWVEEWDGGLLVMRFDEHNGETGKKRAQGAKRAAAFRGKNADITHPSQQSNAASVTGASRPRYLEEEEEEEKKEQIQTPSSLRSDAPLAPKKSAKAVDPVEIPAGADPVLWAEWMTVRKKKGLPVTPRVSAGIQTEAEKSGMTVDQWLTECVTRGAGWLKAAWIQGGQGGTSYTRARDAPRPLTPAERRMFEACPDAVSDDVRQRAGPNVVQMEVFDVAAKRLG